jgi:site-specific recombinase XerD
MLISIFADYNATVEQLIGIDYSKSTWTKYDRTRRFTQEFIQWKYKADDIHIRELDFEFVSQYEFWLKAIHKCGQNTTHKYISILTMVVHHCLNNGWLQSNPFSRFKMSKEQVIPTILSQEEIDKIARKHISIERLRQVRDVYIFCCFTGLAYADVKKLKREEIAIGFDREVWIVTDRLKTKITSRIPLLDTPLRIIKAYENHPDCINGNKVLPVLSNQKYNSYLKELADICGISKKLTSHTARYTFGTTVTLGNGVPIETVSRMLGHKKLATTQHYA